jgi:Flp pilus assembly protein TadD
MAPLNKRRRNQSGPGSAANGGLPTARLYFFALLGLAAFATGCISSGSDKGTPFSGVQELIEQAKSERINDRFIKAGLTALEEGDYLIANREFGAALKFDPANPRLHFLNGLAYHLRAEAGDGSQFDFARIGYGLAVQFDPSDYWAHYLIGRIDYRRQRYEDAQEAFASAALVAPNNPTILVALAAASYYARDLKTANSAIRKALDVGGKNEQAAQIATMIFAASGKFRDSETQLVRFGQLAESNRFRREHLKTRLADWRRIYSAQHIARPGPQLAQDDTSDILGSDNTTEGVTAPTSDDSSSSSSDSSSGTQKQGDMTKIPEMALVDVTIIRSEEISTTIKGVNLLSGLQAAFNYTALSLNDVKTQDLVSPVNTTHTLTNTKAVSLAAPAAINYSLNIFNDNGDYNEVLARPTLTAVDGKTSEFFAGSVLHVELDGVAGSEGTVTTVPIGVRLQVTPNFLTKDTVRYEVEAARAYIEDRSAQSNFNNFTQTTKTEVKGSVVMRFGETLVISGLSEREDERLKDGVPILQDVPGLQYLFSQENKLKSKKSILILVTPRRPRYTYADGTAKPAEKSSKKPKAKPGLKSLTSRPDWFQPETHVDAVLNHLQERTLFNQFRAGDVRLERWENPFTLSEILKRTLSFLYY